MTTLVQQSVGLATRTLATSPTDGRLLLVAFGSRNGTGTIGAGYTDCGEGYVANSVSDGVQIAAKIAASDVATIAGSFPNNARVAFAEFDGISSATPSDSTSATGQGYTATAGSLSYGVGDLVVLAVGNGAGGGFDAAGGYINQWTLAPEWTKWTDAKVFDGHPEVCLAYFIATSAGTIAITADFVHDHQGSAGFDSGWPWAIAGAVYGGVASPPVPGPVVGISDPGDVFIGDLPGAYAVKFRVELNGTGTGEFKINRHDPDATETLLKKGNIVRVTVPQIDPDAVFLFFLESGDFSLVDSDEEGGEELFFSGRGGLAYWERAIWIAESFLVPWWTGVTPPAAGDIGQISFRAGTYYRYTVSGGHASSPIKFTTGGFTAFYDTRRQYTRTGLGPITLVHIRSGSHAGWYVHPFGPGVTDRKKKSAYTLGPSVLMSNLSANRLPGEVIYKMYQEAIASDRPVHPLVGMTIDFTATLDSDGNPWASSDALAALSAELGDQYLATIAQIINLTAAIDVYVDPDLGMHAYNGYGRDLSGTTFGSGKVIFRRAVNIADNVRRVFSEPPVGTFAEVLGSEENSIVRVLSNPDSAPDREISVRGDTDDPDALTALGQGELDARRLHSDTLAFAVDTPIIGREDPDNGRYLPGPPDSANGDYWVGDVVTVDTGTGLFDFDNVDVRVYAITIEFDDADNMNVVVEVMSGFGGIPTLGSGTSGSVSGGSAGGTVTSLQDIYQPLSERDEAAGYPSLDANGKVPRGEVHVLLRSVRGASTGPGIALTDFIPGFVHDGVTYAAGDDFLWKDSTDPTEHGIYVVADSGAPFRRDDFDESDEVVGALVFIREGTTLAQTAWVCTNTDDPVIDTDDITFAQFLPDVDVSALTAAVFGYLDHGNAGSTETFNASVAGWHKATLDANLTASFAGATAGQVASMVLELAQDSTGGRTVDFPASVINGSDLEASLNPGASTTTYYVFFSHDGGVNWIGFVLGGGSAASATYIWKPVMVANPAIVADGEPVWVPVTMTDGEPVMVYVPL